MNKVFLCLLTLAVIIGSCGKSVKPPIHYSVTNDINDSVVEDVYIPDNGTYTMNVKVKFLEGYQGDQDKVQLVLNGLPPHVTVTPDTFSSIPTYSEGFTFTSTGATQGVYPASLTASTFYGLPQIYYFNIHVIPADCAALFWGNITGSNACTSRLFTHTAIGSSGGTNVLNVNNFGGYGNSVNVTVMLNCNNDSLSIPKGTYGNNVMVEGKGIFNNDSMIIYYTASNSPTGSSETCTMTYKRQ